MNTPRPYIAVVVLCGIEGEPAGTVTILQLFWRKRFINSTTVYRSKLAKI